MVLCFLITPKFVYSKGQRLKQTIVVYEVVSMVYSHTTPSNKINSIVTKIFQGYFKLYYAHYIFVTPWARAH